MWQIHMKKKQKTNVGQYTPEQPLIAASLLLAT